MRIKGIVKYKGTNYYGWQKQVKEISIEEVIEKVLSKILDEEINIFASGRTDAGVHALGQVFHFDTSKEFDLDKLIYATNSLLPKDIAIVSFDEVSSNFQARYDAKKKHYRYIIDFSNKNPFSYETSYNCLHKTDKELLKSSLLKFIGSHDYKDFTAKEEDEANFIRNIFDITIKEDKDLFIIDLYGDGFMRYMIRFIIGASLAVAWKKEDISFIDYHLSNKENREIISYKAPPQGLYLVEVIY
jgi:tRNA pseudouridine38-40 synthase